MQAVLSLSFMVINNRVSRRQPMIEYQFEFDDGLKLRYSIDPDRAASTRPVQEGPAWARLDYHQCQHCPLAVQEWPYCPAALDLQELAKDFQNLPANRKAQVTVITPEREYTKRVMLEEGVRALMGLIMATSACPHFAELRANARHHLPFATQEEFIIRSISSYLLTQYFILREGGEPDWELKGLVRINEQLQKVNHAFWQRLVTQFQNDSNSKALLNFFSLSSSLTATLEAQVAKIRPQFYKHPGD